MSNVIEKLQTRETGYRQPGRRRGCPVMSDVHTATMLSERLTPTMYEHLMRVEVGTKFVCNSAQYDDAYRYARKCLAHELYKDVHEAIHKLHMAAISDDEALIHALLDDLEESISE